MIENVFKEDKVKVTGTKGYVQIEDDNGNIARFDGEVCLGRFYAYADSVRWIRHAGEATDKDRLNLIYQATRYGKNCGEKILFFDDDGKVLFETELGLKTEVYWSKTHLVIVAVAVLSLVFPVALLVVLDLVSLMFAIVFASVSALLVSPFLVWGFQIWRFRLTAEGAIITVRPTAGRKYTFPVDDVTRIIRKTKTDSGWEEIKKIRVYTKTRHLSLNDNMTGIEDMDAYFLRHISPDKIITKKRK